MKKLILITILTTALVNCSQETRIEEYTCNYHDMYDIFLTFDTENDLWKHVSDTEDQVTSNGRISQKNDYYFAMSMLNSLEDEELAYAFNRKEKRWFGGLEDLDDLDIAYISEYDIKDHLIANCK